MRRRSEVVHLDELRIARLVEEVRALRDRNARELDRTAHQTPGAPKGACGPRAVSRALPRLRALQKIERQLSDVLLAASFPGAPEHRYRFLRDVIALAATRLDRDARSARGDAALRVAAEQLAGLLVEPADRRP